MNLPFDVSSWAFLVHLAAFSQVCGYLVRNQLVLRGLLLTGTCLYAAYYILFPATPLWDAVFWSAVMATANASVMVVMIRDRRQHAMTEKELQLFRSMHQLTPGDFRRLMRIGTMRVVNGDTRLTTAGERPTHLFFVLDGEIRIEKDGRTFIYPPDAFIGEVSMLTNQPASASVTLLAGGSYVSWNRKDLSDLLLRNHSMKIAFDALLNRDMAKKVGKSSG